MSNSARWSLVALVMVAALVVAIWPRGEDEASSYDDRFGQTGRTPVGEVDADPSTLTALRADAALEACPEPGTAGAGAALAGITLSCLADGTPVDLADALAGRPALVNLWAYWCAPCAEELPYLQEFSARAGDAVTVLTVHSDPNETEALGRLVAYDVSLSGVQDPSGRVRAAVSAPPVLPVSVLVRADGTVAKVLPQPFHSVDEIADAVDEQLGVAV